MITNKCGIYKITNIISGDYYIGSSSNIRDRFCHHRRALSNNVHRNIYLQRSYNKHGERAFEFTTILLCDIEHKLYYEQRLINLLKPTYNMAICASAPMQGRRHSEETRHKMSEARKGELSYMFGTHHTEEQKRKISAANKGNTNCLGYKHTEESKSKNSETQKRRMEEKRLSSNSR